MGKVKGKPSDQLSLIYELLKHIHEMPETEFQKLLKKRRKET